MYELAIQLGMDRLAGNMGGKGTPEGGKQEVRR